MQELLELLNHQVPQGISGHLGVLGDAEDKQVLLKDSVKPTK